MKTEVTLTTASSLTGDKAKGTAVASANRRLGPYDKDIELFRDGQIVDAFLHDLLPGDSFCTKDNPQLWLYVTGNMKSWIDRNGHLNFRMDGMEVLQARPTVERRPERILPSEHTSKKQLSVADLRSIGAPQPAIGNGEIPKSSQELDVDDVEFKDV